MTIDEIKKQIQSILGDGLAVIIGCGLSCAEGLPGMSGLADALQEGIPSLRHDPVEREWLLISERLSKGIGLEAALAGVELPGPLFDSIVAVTADLFRSHEKAVIHDVIEGRKQLRLSKLSKAITIPSNGLPIITTNYDRLVEIACESNGISVDSMFVGSFLGKLHYKESSFSFCRGLTRRQGKLTLSYSPRIKIFKPHGSLDWYNHQGKAIRASFDLDLPPLIIPPGEMKYRAGYNEPFDAHREFANREIDRSSRYLIIGYGFNDSHLQTHLDRNLRSGKACLVVTRDLSPSAESLIRVCPNVRTLTESRTMKDATTYRDVTGSEHQIMGNWWDIGNLSEEVFL